MIVQDAPQDVIGLTKGKASKSGDYPKWISDRFERETPHWAEKRWGGDGRHGKSNG